MILLLVIFFSGCNPHKQEEAEADKHIQLIMELIHANKLNEAKAQIDSVHALYPRLVKKRKVVVALNDTIILRESYKTMHYCEQVLPQMKKEYEKLLTFFEYEKNQKYDETGKYVYNTQLAEQNAGKNYLKVEVAEKGDMNLVSVYSGSKINQSTLKVSTSVLSASTDTTSKNTGVFHSFNDGSTYYEYLTFVNEADGGVVSFVNSNKNSEIKVTLQGTRNFSYILNETDKKAISASFLLSNAIKTIRKTENDLRIAQQRIGKIKLLYN